MAALLPLLIVIFLGVLFYFLFITGKQQKDPDAIALIIVGGFVFILVPLLVLLTDWL